MSHALEQAKTARATCRTCREKIAKDAWRVGEEVPNAFDPDGGTTFQWHHLLCAARARPHVTREALDLHGAQLPPETRAEVDPVLAEAVAHAKPPFPYAERAPTGRARCQACRQPIAKDAFRVAVARPADSVPSDGAAYLHPACAPGHQEDPGLAARVLANSRLPAEDMAEVERQMALPPAPA